MIPPTRETARADVMILVLRLPTTCVVISTRLTYRSVEKVGGGCELSVNVIGEAVPRQPEADPAHSREALTPYLDALLGA